MQKDYSIDQIASQISIHMLLTQFISPHSSSFHYSEWTISIHRLDETINFSTDILERFRSIKIGESNDIDLSILRLDENFEVKIKKQKVSSMRKWNSH